MSLKKQGVKLPTETPPTAQNLLRKIYILLTASPVVLVWIVLVRLDRIRGVVPEQMSPSTITYPTFQETWSIPEGRECLAAACVNVGGQDFIYAVGGKNPSGGVTNTVFHARVSSQGQTSNWETENNAFGDTVFFHPALVPAGGRLYLLGGNDGGQPLGSVYQTQPESGTGHTEWLTTTPLSIPVYLHAAVALGNRIYVIGGHQESSSVTAEVFSATVLADGNLSEWGSESNLESLTGGGIWGHSAVASEEHQCIYVIGGWLGSLSSGMAHNKVFRACITEDGKLGSWETETETLPLISEDAVGMYYHSAAIVDNNLFVIGGTAYTPGSPESTDSIYVGHIISPSGHLGNWSVCTHCLPWNLERQALAVASIGTLYVIGGTDRSSVYDTVLFTPLLDFKKSAQPSFSSVTYGDSITYTLALTNFGVRDLDHLAITDTVQTNIPTALEFHSVPTECQVCPDIANTLTCTIPSLELGQSRSLSFTATISQPTPSSHSTLHSFQALVGKRDMETHDPDANYPRSLQIIEPLTTHTLEQNSISNNLTPLCDTDLRLEKSGIPDLVVAGRELTYTLLVHNDGLSEAQDVIVVDNLPQGVTFMSATLPPISSTGSLTWHLGSIPTEDSKEIHFVVRVDPDTSGILINTATVDSSTQDTNLDSNQAEEHTEVVRQADLRIEKHGNPSRVIPGDTLVHTLRVHNDGPSDASNVTVTDTLPTAVTFLSSMPTPNELTPLTWYTNTLTAGDVWTIGITVSVKASAFGLLTNSANVNSEVFDPDLSNNRDEEQTLAPIVVINRAYICEDGLWCKESNTVVNSPFTVYLPITLRSG